MTKSINITDDKLHSNDFNINFFTTPNFTPNKRNICDYIILHFTGVGKVASSLSWFSKAESKVSSQIIVDRNGDIFQISTGMRTVCWHAGVSKWNNIIGLNTQSIGIEMVNCGLLTKRIEKFYDAYNTEVSKEDVYTDSSGKFWHKYTTQQLESVYALIEIFARQYKIKEVLGHSDIAQGRKVDPGAAFPMQQARDVLNNIRKHQFI